MDKKGSYKISIPVKLHDHFCKEEVLDALKECRAERIFLATGVLSLEPGKYDRLLEMLKEYVPYFQSHGLEVGIWFWSFWRSGLAPDELDQYLIVNMEGNRRAGGEELGNGIQEGAGFCCPASEKFLASASATIEALASCHPDILMLDDDYRFGFHDFSLGCFCGTHMGLYEKKLGRKLSREELLEGIYAEQPNEIRRGVLEVLGESMEEFARRVRTAVDRVDPKIRVALCSVMSLWDTDGSDSITIAKLLAGKTKPLLRLIGAPYWAVRQNWGNRLQHIIETERMEDAWCDGEELEIMTEGDVYPRPRHRVPASYLEGFDLALRAAGVGDGILKYMLDYDSSVQYETGYMKRHMEHYDLYEDVKRFFGGKQESGVRVYETVNKFCDSNLKGIPKPWEYVQNQFFSVAARLLSDNTIPTRYRGNEGVGIAFGENARHLPEEALENGLILDIRGAGILMERGIDVGIVSVGERLEAEQLYYPGCHGRREEYVGCGYGPGTVYRLELKEKAVVLNYAVKGEARWPEAFAYQNEEGHRFLVYAFDEAVVSEEQYRSYSRQNQLYDVIEWLADKPLPAKCPGNPDLYILCKKSEEGMAVGLWNFFPDQIAEPIVELDRAYTGAEFANCTGVLQGCTLKLSALQAYEAVFVNLFL